MGIPILINKESVVILIVGAGDVAYKKASKFLKKRFEVYVIGEKINPNFLCWNNCHVEEGKYNYKFLEKFAGRASLVIGATNNPDINKKISEYSKKLGFLFLDVSDGKNSSFSLMSFFERKNIIVSAYTFGRSPSISKKIIEDIDNFLIEDIDEIIEILGYIRNRVKTCDISQTSRKKILNKIARLELDELNRIMNKNDKDFNSYIFYELREDVVK